MASNDSVRKLMIQMADNYFFPYPQYKNYHKDCDLAVVKENLKFKGGDVPAGSIILIKIKKEITGLHATLLNFENFHHCALDSNYLSKVMFL